MAGVQRSMKQCEKILRKNGFTKERSKGDHFVWKRGKQDVIVLTLNPNAMMFQSQIKKYNLKLK